MDLPKFVSPEALEAIQARQLKAGQVEEIAVVKNSSFVYPPVDYYPLAPRSQGNLPLVAGVVKDMDGTTTTTETLCIHSLETMVRRITGQLDLSSWPGLDREKDYPHIIGNSTTRHVEYLVRTYASAIRPDALGQAYLQSALWTLAEGKDEQRKQEVRANLVNLGFEGVAKEPLFQSMIERQRLDAEALAPALSQWWEKHRGGAKLESFTNVVRAAIDIYYVRYHEILAAVAGASGRDVAEQVLGDATRKLIEPMPGVAVYLALIKGWLGEDLRRFGPELLEAAKAKRGEDPALEQNLERLPALGRFFEHHPAQVGVVTSSIAYEADIVLSEVFELLRRQVTDWPVEAAKKERVLEAFSDFRRCYDAYVTASDSSEIRLKPHRDLYCIALHRMGIEPDAFNRVVGFEDSESGTIAIRAAGVGLCVAVPFADTAGHDLSAAAFCLHRGLPEAILRHLHFLDPAVL